MIVGPTASGKSGLAVELAKQFDGEVISADSRQVYRGLNIGTGKVTKREMSGIPHHLLDVASPAKVYNADDFARDATVVITDIISRGKLPIVAGGTGFYIDSLTGRIALPNVPPNKTLRSRLEKKSAEQLYKELSKKDPRRAKMMSTPSERNNKVRLIRALEIAAFKPTKLQRTVLCNSYNVLWIGIAPTLEELDTKILLRLKSRIKTGMITEAKKLHATGLSYKRMTALGLEYRSLARLLQEKISRKEFEEELFAAIRRYARKQVGYWKRNKEISWYKPTEQKKIAVRVKQWLASL